MTEEDKPTTRRSRKRVVDEKPTQAQTKRKVTRRSPAKKETSKGTATKKASTKASTKVPAKATRRQQVNAAKKKKAKANPSNSGRVKWPQGKAPNERSYQAMVKRLVKEHGEGMPQTAAGQVCFIDKQWDEESVFKLMKEVKVGKVNELTLAKVKNLRRRLYRNDKGDRADSPD